MGENDSRLRGLDACAIACAPASLSRRLRGVVDACPLGDGARGVADATDSASRGVASGVYLAMEGRRAAPIEV